MRGLGRIVGALALTLLVPAIAFAQASISGTVKDASGAVLPGVTVEAASDVLMILDTPAWAVLDGLIAECPVLRSPASFEFIGGDDQIAAIDRFLADLPSMLSGPNP